MTKILSTVLAQDYAAQARATIGGFANAGDGTVSRDAYIAAMKAWMVDDAQIDPILKQVMTLVGNVTGSNITKGQALTAVISVAGTGYSVGDKFTVDSSTGTGAFALVTAVDGSGVITAVTLGGAGANYNVADTATSYVPVDALNPGSGATIEVTIATNETKLLQDVQAAL